MTDEQLEEDEDERRELAERMHLFEKILAAFRQFPIPQEPLVRYHSPLADDVQRVLQGKERNAVTAADLRSIRLDMRALTPAAFWYFFPQIARQILIGHDYVDGLAESTIALLSPPDELDEEFQQLVHMINVEQKAAVADFVNWYSDQEGTLHNRDRLLHFWRTQPAHGDRTD